MSLSRVSAPTHTAVGYTGSLANSIGALPVLSSVTDHLVVFTEYYVARALPTAWAVPFDGDGRIAFTPLPGSSTARTGVRLGALHHIAVNPTGS
jgi:hypothetical protein